jgi:4-oxalocrotonate tautomerase
MPVVRIEMWAGRSREQKRKMIKEVTEAITSSLGIPKDQVTVILNEIPKDNWGLAGELASKTKK